jgi:putative membrane protein
MSGADWWWMGLMMVFWLAVLMLLVWAVIRISRALDSRHDHAGAAPGRPETAREVLDRRYAAGEIDSATYGEMLARLQSSNSSTANRREEP